MSWTPNPELLRGKVAVVAGATRGTGRGIALGLAEAGCTVICTGRSSRTGSLSSDYGKRPETIEETAELVTSLGGIGVARVVDHLDHAQVEKLAEDIKREYGHIDTLVNDIWGAELLHGGPDQWDTPLWELDLDKGLRMLRLAIDTHLITSHYLLKLMVDRPGSVVVEVTDGTLDYNASHYRISVYYDLAKVSIARLAYSQGHELAKHGCMAVCVTPGFLRSEMMLEHFDVTEDNWLDAAGKTAPPDFALSETPRFVGRGIAAMAADPGHDRWNQQSITSGDLALAYGVTDLDGTQPQVWQYIVDEEKGVARPMEEYRT